MTTLRYADGSDGPLVFDGTSTVLGMTPVGGVYAFARNVFATTLVLDAGAVLDLRNFVALGSVSAEINGELRCNGGNATGSTGGASPGAGSLLSGVAGRSGSVNATPLGVGAGFFGGGGNGGGGSSAGASGSNGVTSALSHAFLVNLRRGSLFAQMSPSAATAFLLGSSTLAGQGDRGGGDAGNPGGGGGGPGGCIFLAAPTITIGASAILSARGGDGGSPSTGNTGGGAGAGGGVAFLYFDTIYGTPLVVGTNVLLDGGTGAAGHGTGGTGGNGATGSLHAIQAPA